MNVESPRLLHWLEQLEKHIHDCIPHHGWWSSLVVKMALVTVGLLVSVLALLLLALIVQVVSVFLVVFVVLYWLAASVQRFRERQWALGLLQLLLLSLSLFLLRRTLFY